MKIKLDENLPLGLRDLATARGLDADTVRDESLLNRSDADVLRAASRVGRCVVTLDRGFPRAAAAQRAAHAGVLILRTRAGTPSELEALFERALHEVESGRTAGRVAVVELARTRWLEKHRKR